MTDQLQDFVESIIDRLPAPVQFIYGQLPRVSAVSSIATRIYSLASQVPGLSVILSLLTAYIAFYTVWSTMRTAMRASSFVLKYGALLGTALTAWSYVQSSFGGDKGVSSRNSQGRRGQDYWANKPSKDYAPSEDDTQASSGSPDWMSVLLNFVNPPSDSDTSSGPRTRSKTNSKSPRGQNSDPNPLTEAAKSVLGKTLKGESVLGAVWDQIKNVGSDYMQGGAQESSSKRRSTRTTN